MAERTAEGGVRLSLVLDQNGQPFVRQVNSAMDGATGAVNKAGTRAGKSFGEILGSGFIIKAAAASLILRRLTAAAGDASPEFGTLKRAAGDAAAAIGGDLQRAIGATLPAVQPFLEFIVNSSGAMRGLIGGLLLGTAAVNTFKVALTALGLSGGAATAVILALGAGMGIAGGLIADKSREAQAKFDAMVTETLAKGRAAAEEQLDQTERSLTDQQNLLIQKQVELDTALRDAAAESESVGTRGSVRTVFSERIKQLRTEIAELNGEIIPGLASAARAQQAAMALFDRSDVVITDNELPIADFIQRQQLAIAAGSRGLDEAREAVKQRRAEIESELKILSDATKLRDADNKDVQAVFQRISGGDAARAEELRAKAAGDTAEQKRLILQVEREANSLLTAQLDLTDRIGQASERVRTTEFNRKVLAAQIVDALNGAAPLQELQVLRDERAVLAVEEHGRAKTRILELDQQIFALLRQIQDAEQSRSEAAADAADSRAKQWRQETQAAGLERIQNEIALLKLAATTEEQFRAARIAALKEQLGLQDLTLSSLQSQVQVMQQLAVIDPEGARQQQQQFTELLGHLEAEKRGLSEMGKEVQIVGDGLVRLADQGSLALVRMVTRGKAEIKDFGEFVLATFEEIFARLLAQQIVLTFLSLFTGGGSRGAGGLIPGPIGDLIPGGGNTTRFGPGSFPALPNPALAQSGGLARLEAQVGALANSVGSLRLQVGEFRLRGKDLRASVQIADATAAPLKTVK